MITEGILNTKFNTLYWFFIPLFSVYLAIPLFTSIPYDNRKKLFGYLIVIGFSVNFLLPFLFSLVKVQYNSSFNLPVMGGYLLFVLTGYWIDNFALSKSIRIVIYSIGVVALLSHIFGTWYLSYSAGTIVSTFKGYLNVPSYLYATAIFTLFKYLNSDIQMCLNKVTHLFSSSTFGIYLTHGFIINYIVTKTTIPTESIIYRTFGAMVIFVSCAIFVSIIQNIPILNKTLPK